MTIKFKHHIFFDVQVQQSIDVPSTHVRVFEAILTSPSFQQSFDVPSTRVPAEDGVTVEIVTSEHCSYYIRVSDLTL